MKTLLALLLAGCSTVPRSECRRVAIQEQHFGQANCVAYAQNVTPLLQRAGATDIRWAVLDTGKPKLHVMVLYTFEGKRWAVDNGSGPRHAVGDTVQEQVQRFSAPWHDSTTMATLVAEVSP